MHPPEDRSDRRRRLGLAALMLGAGTMHFVSPRFFDQLVPAALPGSSRTVTYVSGVAELAAGALTLGRRTTRLGAWMTFFVLLGVYPANIHDTLTHPPTDARGIASLVRLPLQLPMLWFALRHARAAEGGSHASPGA